jgi:hypothetical protein
MHLGAKLNTTSDWSTFFLFGTWNGQIASSCDLRWSYDAWQTKEESGRHLLINVHVSKAGSLLGPFFFCHWSSFDDKMKQGKGEAGRGIYVASLSLDLPISLIYKRLSIYLWWPEGGTDFRADTSQSCNRDGSYEYVTAFIHTHACP